MRTALLVLTACGAIAAMPALAGGSPYCIKGCDFDVGLGDCSFSTYQQCLATASGRVATCAANPFYNVKAEMPADRGRLSRRRF
jgi:hypothetical protein